MAGYLSSPFYSPPGHTARWHFWAFLGIRHGHEMEFWTTRLWAEVIYASSKSGPPKPPIWPSTLDLSPTGQEGRNWGAYMSTWKSFAAYLWYSQDFWPWSGFHSIYSHWVIPFILPPLCQRPLSLLLSTRQCLWSLEPVISSLPDSFTCWLIPQAQSV